MYGIKFAGCFLGELDFFHGDNSEACAFNFVDDCADELFADAIGFQDGKRSFHCGVCIFVS